MSTATMDTEPQQNQDKQCRLCLENITANEINCAIDILDYTDVRLLLQEVYELKVLPDDSSSTMMCLPSYQQLIQDYKFRMKLFTLRKSFKLNQSALVAQIVAFRDIANQQTKSKPNEDRFASMREKSTQTDPSEPPERCSAVTAEPLENGHDESSVEQQPQLNAEPADTTSTEQQLVPLVVDCLKEPRYLKALHHLKVSTDPDKPAPLVLLCSCCYKTFKSQDKLEHHKSVGCVPSCRFCLSERTVNHSCPYQREYANLMQHIFGSEKYVTTYAASETNEDSSLLRLVLANDEQDETGEPTAKKRKLDANRNRRESSSERRSVTPQSWKGDENHTAPEIRPEPETTSRNGASPVINVSSSDDETIKLVLVDPPKPAATERPKIKARRKSARKGW